MIFCVRKAISTTTAGQWYDRLDEDFKNICVPIELGLPFDFKQFQLLSAWMSRIAEKILDNAVPCISIHAPEGPIIGPYEESFLSWARGITDLADQVNARVVIFHPIRLTALSHSVCMDLLVANIQALQQKTRSMVVLETFRGGQYFGYKELLDEGLPICIDTSHMKHVEALDLVERYHNKIVHVHLSEAMGGLTHQPAGKASLELLTRLTELGWDGSVCFEYLDGYAEEMRKDLKAFRSLFG